jgi:hypothetical protein
MKLRTSTTDITVEVEAIIHENRCVRNTDTAAELNVCNRLVLSMIVDCLSICKVTARWVPK